MFIDNQMKLETVEPESRTPTHGGFAAFSYVFENFVGFYAQVVTDPEHGRVDKRNTGYFSFSGIQVSTQWDKSRSHQLHNWSGRPSLKRL